MDSIKSNEDVSNVDVISAKDLLSSGHTYLDVRTTEEYNRGHIDKAINIPYMFLNEQGRVKNPDFLEQVSAVCQKEDHLIVGCNSGGRGLRACVDLLNAVSEPFNFPFIYLFKKNDSSMHKIYYFSRI
nr:protein HIGH ARSENIC CONTENT 1, mitochondrial-like isoform X1 [Solanum lycopersicum]